MHFHVLTMTANGSHIYRLSLKYKSATVSHFFKDSGAVHAYRVPLL